MADIKIRKLDENTVHQQDRPQKAAPPAPAASSMAHPRPYSKVRERVESGSLADLFMAMTPKQKGFALALTQAGMSKSEAYRSVYSSKANPLTTSRNAYHIGSNSKVKLYVEGVQRREWEGTLADAPEIRKVALRVLREIAEKGERENNRMAAAVALGKVATVGLFSERREIVHRTEGAMDVRMELKTRLEQLLGPMQVVDTEAVSEQALVPSKGTDAPTAPDSSDSEAPAGE